MVGIKQNAGVTVAMLRAFVSLSRTLNLTETSEHLKATRQTVRRHISDLERIKGQSLFVLERQEYALTPFGKASVADAESILRQIESWSGQSRMTRHGVNFLEHAHFLDDKGREFFSQQHPVIEIATSGLPIMRRVLAAWGQAQTRIEDEALAQVRPYRVIYRKSPKGWICVEIGEKSAYAMWFGWAWSNSAIGRLSQEDNAGDDFNDFIAGTYVRVYSEGAVRYDHLYAHLPRENSEKPVPISFQRLLMGCVFPDGTPGLAVLVLMTNKIDITGLKPEAENCVPEAFVMDFDL